MAGVLGAWKNGFAYMMILLLAVVVIVFMTSPHFAHSGNKFKVSSTEIRQELSAKVLDNVIPDQAVRAKVMDAVRQIPDSFTEEDWRQALSQQNNPDTPYFNAVRNTLGDTPEARYQFQKYRSLYQQMMMPSVVGKIFPVGMLGLFCLLMIMLLISTDDSRIFNASSTLMQDVILPMFKGHLDQKTHLLLLRILLCPASAGLFFYLVKTIFYFLPYSFAEGFNSRPQQYENRFPFAAKTSSYNISACGILGGLDGREIPLPRVLNARETESCGNRAPHEYALCPVGRP